MTSTPPGALSDSATRVVLAVCDGATTYNELMARVGVSRSVLHKYLHLLRDEGLVDFDPKTRGTLHPLVHELVPPGYRCSCMLDVENPRTG